MQLTQRQCFTAAALGQRPRWELAAQLSARPAASPGGYCTRRDPYKHTRAARRAPSYTCRRRCRRLRAAAATPLRALSGLPQRPHACSAACVAGCGVLCRQPALPPCLALAARTPRRSWRRRSSSGAEREARKHQVNAAAGAAQRWSSSQQVRSSQTDSWPRTSCCPLSAQEAAGGAAAAPLQLVAGRGAGAAGRGVQVPAGPGLQEAGVCWRDPPAVGVQQLVVCDYTCHSHACCKVVA